MRSPSTAGRSNRASRSRRRSSCCPDRRVDGRRREPREGQHAARPRGARRPRSRGASARSPRPRFSPTTTPPLQMAAEGAAGERGRRVRRDPRQGRACSRASRGAPRRAPKGGRRPAGRRDETATSRSTRQRQGEARARRRGVRPGPRGRRRRGLGPRPRRAVLRHRRRPSCGSSASSSSSWARCSRSLAVLCVRWLARRITAPASHPGARGRRRSPPGTCSTAFPVSGAKELSDLARAFNTMSDRLQEKARRVRRSSRTRSSG